MKASSAILGSEDLMTSLSPTAFLDAQVQAQVRAAARSDQEAFARLVDAVWRRSSPKIPAPASGTSANSGYSSWQRS